MEIKLRNVAKRYIGNVKYTLENINLNIKSGEFTVLLGPSGCGKTTLLRMIAGLNSITKGELLFNGTKVNNLEPKDRDLAMVFQSYALYPHLTVYKNMSYSLKIMGFKKEFIDRRVKNVAKILEIDHLLFNKPSEISGGQRQRVALGRAIVRKPSIFLMDEPLSNLDAKLRELMRVELVRIHKLVKATTIYVTHDQLEAMTMADKIVLFNDKVIQQIGKPEDLYNKPNNVFVAKFIGSPSMNLIHLVKNKNKWFIKNSKTLVNISKKTQNFLDKFKKDQIILGIRSEDVEINIKKNNITMQGEIEIKELLGKEMILSIMYKEKKVIKVSANAQTIIKVGQKVPLYFDEEKIHLFDIATNQRIN